jgi:hypothetical protein
LKLIDVKVGCEHISSPMCVVLSEWRSFCFV